MKRFGEIVSIDNTTALVRIYKEKQGSSKPTALTMLASLYGSPSVGDRVLLDIPLMPFLVSSFAAYLLPFVTSFAAVVIARIFTKSIIVCDIVMLAALLLTYIFSALSRRLPIFKKPLCKAYKKT